MGSKQDKRSKAAGVRGAGRPPPVSAPAPAPDALDRELRELHDRYGADVEVPERLVELARRVADAFAKLEHEDAAKPPDDRRG